jgi:hypothetical protein
MKPLRYGASTPVKRPCGARSTGIRWPKASITGGDVSILRSLGYPNRVVALLTPILSPLAGWLATVIADRVPGIPKSALNEIFIAGSVLALAPALQFLQGRLKWDLQQDQKATALAPAVGAAPSADQFAALGIAAPGDAVAAPATEAFDDTEPVDATLEGADESDILDEVGDLLDDEDELDGLEEPLEPTPAEA